MDILSIPGYAEAIVRERIVRDAAFLGIHESIGPFEVVSMTLRHWVVLRMMNSPLLRNGTPDPIDLVNFLWLLSPKFTRHKGWARRLFDRRCRKHFLPPNNYSLWNTRFSRIKFKLKCEKRLLNAAKMIDSAREYVGETMQDRPPSQPTLIYEIDYYSDPAYFCAIMGREFGWSQDEVLDTPLKRLFQYLNEMKSYHRSPVPLCNPSDSVKADWMRSLNKPKINGN